MKVATVKQQPGEKRQYAVDYDDALDPSDEIISVSTVVEPTGCNISAIGNDRQLRVIAQGGEDGVTYKATFTITTTNTNEIIEDEFYVKVKEI